MPAEETRSESSLDVVLEGHALVLFDGVCNLCNSSVNFIIDRDRARYFKFATLQDETVEPLGGWRLVYAIVYPMLWLGPVYLWSRRALRRRMLR